ncbi:UNVERIFIED_CONTAM: ABC transporter permease [Campylobacter lari]
MNENILKIVNKFNTQDNLPFYNETGFGITNALENPELITFFDKVNDIYQNAEVARFVENNSNYDAIIQNNKHELITLLGLIGASKLYTSSSNYPNGIYYYAIDDFYQKYLKTDEFLNNRELINKLAIRFKLNIPLELFNISPVIINPILRLIFPQVLLSYITSEKVIPGSVNGNLANIVLNKLPNFEEVINQKADIISVVLKRLFENNNSALVPLDLDREKLLVLDGALIDTMFQKGNKTAVFGLNIIDFVRNILNEIVEPKEIKDIVFNNIQSYIAKVNYAYLIKNNKAIYNGKIPSNNVEMEALINNLEDKYVLNVNGIKFLIVGDDTTVDYIYPVIDENNLQVNTETQALVYVNDSGFSRVRAAYQGNVVKKDLLVANSAKTKLTNIQLKNKIINIVDNSISDSNKLQRVFLYNEIDPVNPERALRITTIIGVISTVSSSTLVLMIVLIFIVSISIIFIIKRYISNKNKVFGILLAQGYKPIEIAISLTVFAAVTSIIGGILGYAIGNRGQLFIQNIFSLYWTLPKDSIPFSITALFFNVFVPYIGMSLLIIVTSLIALRYKPIDLITGTYETPHGKSFLRLKRFTKNQNIKKRFS